MQLRWLWWAFRELVVFIYVLRFTASHAQNVCWYIVQKILTSSSGASRFSSKRGGIFKKKIHVYAMTLYSSNPTFTHLDLVSPGWRHWPSQSVPQESEWQKSSTCRTVRDKRLPVEKTQLEFVNVFLYIQLHLATRAYWKDEVLITRVTDCGIVGSTKEDEFSSFSSTPTIIMHVSAAHTPRNNVRRLYAICSTVWVHILLFYSTSSLNEQCHLLSWIAVGASSILFQWNIVVRFLLCRLLGTCMLGSPPQACLVFCVS